MLREDGRQVIVQRRTEPLELTAAFIASHEVAPELRRATTLANQVVIPALVELSQRRIARKRLEASVAEVGVLDDSVRCFIRAHLWPRGNRLRPPICDC